MIRAILPLSLAVVPFVAILGTPPDTMPLRERINAARTDILERHCTTDGECHLRIALYGLDPEYYEGPDDWLECRCDEGDATACAYLEAWQGLEDDAASE